MVITFDFDDTLLRNGGAPDAAMQWLVSKMGTAA